MRLLLFSRGNRLLLIAVGIVFLILLFLKYGYFAGSTRNYSVCIESVEGTKIIQVTPEFKEELQISGPLGKTVIRVEDGKVWVVSSPCPNKTCMRMGKIPDNGGFIACLPNKVLIYLKKHP
ncbi:MAG TPA: hypothetical protein ENL28_01645 [Candidatus Atribacteria bacterium]|nr:hypothetical protein [Candidatus Atribacteria bacterium]